MSADLLLFWKRQITNWDLRRELGAATQFVPYVMFSIAILRSAANICAIDLSKAFDKVNHHGFFLKLMAKRIPVELLALLENLAPCGLRGRK